MNPIGCIWVHAAPIQAERQQVMNQELALRLKEERERLGLSQTEFAKKMGVHRNTVVRYESGEREPDTGFLARVGDIGVDPGYLLFGRKTDPVSMFSLGVARVLPLVAERAGLCSKALLDLLWIASEEEAHMWGPTAELPGSKKVNWPDLLDAYFENGELLGNVFYEVARVTQEKGLSIPFNKKARAISMLYRSAVTSGGTIDPAVVEEALTLAAD